MNVKKAVAITMIIIITLNLVLFGFGMFGYIPFWGIILIVAIIAFQVIPRIKS